jgi:hypothetical protein
MRLAILHSLSVRMTERKLSAFERALAEIRAEDDLRYARRRAIKSENCQPNLANRYIVQC